MLPDLAAVAAEVLPGVAVITSGPSTLWGGAVVTISHPALVVRDALTWASKPYTIAVSGTWGSPTFDVRCSNGSGRCYVKGPEALVDALRCFGRPVLEDGAVDDVRAAG